MIHQNHALSFECTACGACCCGDDDYYIEINADDMRRIAGFLNISMAWLKRRYTRHHSRTLYSIRIADSGRCVFLGKDMKCKIYKVRPVQCRTYPWWPELLESKTVWNAEARRCEGINRGQQVPLTRIMRSLKQQLAFEKNNECD